MANEYISVVKDNRTTDQVVKMTAPENVFAGTLKTKNESGGTDDVNEVFIAGVEVTNGRVEQKTQNGKKVVKITVPPKGIQSLSLVGWGSGTDTTPGTDGGKIDAEEDPDNPGHFTITLKELGFDDLSVNKLYLNNVDITYLIPNLRRIRDGEIEEAKKVNPDVFQIDQLRDKYNDLVDKFNALLFVLKNSTPNS